MSRQRSREVRRLSYDDPRLSKAARELLSATPLYAATLPRRLAAALAAEILRADQGVYACVADESLREALRLAGIEENRVHGCTDCPSDKPVVVLWCNGAEISRAVLAVACCTRREAREAGLVEIRAEQRGPGSYLVVIGGERPRRLHVEVRGFKILDPLEDPCRDEAYDAILEAYGCRDVTLREAVDAVAAALGLKRGEAREAVARLMEKGCLEPSGAKTLRPVSC